MQYNFGRDGTMDRVLVLMKSTYKDQVNRHLSERFKFENFAHNGNTSFFRNSHNVDGAIISVDASTSGIPTDTLMVVSYSRYSDARKESIREEEAKAKTTEHLKK
ncbi:hypothetical protein FQZ97_1054280 [compost metagenome]